MCSLGVPAFHCHKILEKINLKDKRLVLLSLPEVSFRGGLALSLAYGKAESYGGGACRITKLLISAWVGSRHRQGKWLELQNFLQRGRHGGTAVSSLGRPRQENRESWISWTSQRDRGSKQTNLTDPLAAQFQCPTPSLQAPSPRLPHRPTAPASGFQPSTHGLVENI